MLTLRLRTAVCGCAPTKQDDLPALGLIPSGGVFFASAALGSRGVSSLTVDPNGKSPPRREMLGNPN